MTRFVAWHGLLVGRDCLHCLQASSATQPRRFKITPFCPPNHLVLALHYALWNLPHLPAPIQLVDLPNSKFAGKKKMTDEYLPNQSWLRKFRDAFLGMFRAFRDERSFHVHLFFAVAVIVAAIVFKVSIAEWCILLLCIAVVLAAEMFNTALEHLGKAVDRSENQHIGNALDIGSAAVLVAAIGAVIVGCVVFAARLVIWWQGGS